MTVNVESFVPADSFNHNVVRFTTDLGYTTSLQYDETSFRIPDWVTSIEYLIVAGGGGGAGFRGSGGGAGGMLVGTMNVNGGEYYSIKIGRGGYGTLGKVSNAYQGGPSAIGVIQATGGGFGCSNNYSVHTGGNGGSGGGGARGGPGGFGIAGQGYNGGTNAGGGAGGLPSSYTGGIGVISTITGSVVYYAGGGSGYSGSSSKQPGPLGGGGCAGALQSSVEGRAGCNGTDGLGGGGGGGGELGGGGDDGNAKGGNGGSGVVILRYIKGYMYVREYEVEYLGV